MTNDACGKPQSYSKCLRSGHACVGADFGQDAVEPLAASAKLPEGIVDARRPVNAGDDLAAWCSSGGETVAVDTECELDDARNAVRFAEAAIVGERLRITASRFHHAVQMLFADHAKLSGPHRLAVPLERGQQLRDVVAVGLLASKKIMQRHMLGAGLSQDQLPLRGS